MQCLQSAAIVPQFPIIDASLLWRSSTAKKRSSATNPFLPRITQIFLTLSFSWILSYRNLIQRRSSSSRNTELILQKTAQKPRTTNSWNSFNLSSRSWRRRRDPSFEWRTYLAFRKIEGVSRWANWKTGTSGAVSGLFHLNLNPWRCERGSTRSYYAVQ